MKLNDTHWLVRLAKFGGMYVPRWAYLGPVQESLCSIVRWALAGVAKGLVIAAALLAASTLTFLGALANLVHNLWTGNWVMWPLTGANLMAMGVLAAAAAVIGCRIAFDRFVQPKLRLWLSKRERERPIVAEPNIVVEAYRAWKAKYCPVVEIEVTEATR